METFKKEILIKGQPKEVKCLEIDGQTYTVSKGLARTVYLEEEWYEDFRDPNGAIAALKNASLGADIFTFWQRFPNIAP